MLRSSQNDRSGGGLCRDGTIVHAVRRISVVLSEKQEMKLNHLLGIGLVPVAACSGVFRSWAHCSAPQEDPESVCGRPNVVFILADDLGYFDLSWRHNPHMRRYSKGMIDTPNIDSLAANGMVFTQHYSGSSVSAPARASLITGLHTGHTPVRGNLEYYGADAYGSPLQSDGRGEGQQPIPAHTDQIFKLLKAAGYETGVFGKWGLGYPGSEGSPEFQSVDEFYGYNCQRQAHYYYPGHLWRSSGAEARRVEFPQNANRIEDYFDREKDLTGIYSETDEGRGVYVPYVIHDEAIDFIEEHAGRPFFLWYTTPLPHAELQVPNGRLRKAVEKCRKRGYDPGVPGGDRSGALQGGYARQEYPTAAYIAMVELLDEQVGEIVATLRRQGIYDDTIVVFASDNGAHREGGHNPDLFRSRGPMRGDKRSLYDGGIRVPFIVQWPAAVKRGSETDHLSAFCDFYATMADIVGIDIADRSKDGISYLPTLTGTGEQALHDYLYWEFHNDGGRGPWSVALRSGDWKIVRDGFRESDYMDRLELYRIAGDIGETSDRRADDGDRLESLRTLMQRCRERSPHFPFPGDRP